MGGGGLAGPDEELGPRMPSGFFEYARRMPPLTSPLRVCPYISLSARAAKETSSNSTKHIGLRSSASASCCEGHLQPLAYPWLFCRKDRRLKPGQVEKTSRSFSSSCPGVSALVILGRALGSPPTYNVEMGMLLSSARAPGPRPACRAGILKSAKVGEVGETNAYCLC